MRSDEAEAIMRVVDELVRHREELHKLTTTAYLMALSIMFAILGVVFALRAKR